MLYAHFTTSEGNFTARLFDAETPNTVANFTGLADGSKEWTDPRSGQKVKQPYFNGTIFHRVIADFMIQGGDPEGTGSGGPGYTITDEPVTTPYKRGTVAMARTAAPNSVGSQYFIVLDDKDGAVLSSANTYQIIGNVTSGMEVAEAIYQASAGVELPANPIKITTTSVVNP